MPNYNHCYNRLKKFLRALPQDDPPMTMSEFDGFTTGILACPEDIPNFEWLPQVCGMQGFSHFSDQPTLLTTIEAVLAYFEAVELGMSDTGLVRPRFQETGQYNSKIWEPWIDGYLRAAALRPTVWQDFYEKADEDVQTMMSFIQSLHDISTGRSRLSASQITEIDLMADEAIVHCVTHIIKFSRPTRLGVQSRHLVDRV